MTPRTGVGTTGARAGGDPAGDGVVTGDRRTPIPDVDPGTARAAAAPVGVVTVVEDTMHHHGGLRRAGAQLHARPERALIQLPGRLPRASRREGPVMLP